MQPYDQDPSRTVREPTSVPTTHRLAWTVFGFRWMPESAHGDAGGYGGCVPDAAV